MVDAALPALLRSAFSSYGIVIISIMAAVDVDAEDLGVAGRCCMLLLLLRNDGDSGSCLTDKGEGEVKICLIMTERKKNIKNLLFAIFIGAS